MIIAVGSASLEPTYIELDNHIIMTTITNIYQNFIKNSALSLLLLAPFLDFLRFNNYSLLRPEAIIIFIALVILGVVCSRICRALGTVGNIVLTALLITIAFSFFPTYTSIAALLFVFMAALLFCMLFTKHAHELIGIIFLVFALGIFFLPMQTQAADPVIWHKDIPHKSAQLPPVIYIILDEHAGIEAIPPETQQGIALKENLKAFYAQNGFQLFGSAYSHYPNTYNSIPNLLNFTDSTVDNYYFDSDTHRELKQNLLFNLFAKKGYQFRIYQGGDYLDYCTIKNIPIASCYSFSTLSVGMMAQTSLPLWQRFEFLLKGFLLQSSLYQIAMDFYQYQLRPLSEVYNIPIPKWDWDEARVSSLSMLKTFAQLNVDVQQNPNGTVFFAHIFAPHSPYAYDADCHLLPVGQWQVGTVPMPFVKNTSETRALIYKTYEGQTTCVQKQLQIIFNNLHAAKIYDNAIIIVQGDHGSRIAIHKPFFENQSELTVQDFKDYYMTLFAVKIPGKSAIYNTQLLDLQTLLAGIMPNIAGQTVAVRQISPYVYLLPPKVGMPLVKMSVRDFSNPP